MTYQRNTMVEPYRASLHAVLALTIALLVSSFTTANAQLLDFEDPDLTEGDIVSTQYSTGGCGVTFYLGSTESGRHPVLSEVGGPGYFAFQGPRRTEPDCGITNATRHDMPAEDQGVGCKFLTDGNGLGSNPPTLVIVYGSPVTKASGDLLDVDRNEEWTIRAYNGTTKIGSDIVLDPSLPDAGEGLATYWEVDFGEEFDRLELDYTGTSPGVGLAFDNFSTCTLRSEQQISIDIKPGSSTNPINLKSKGVIPVAVYTTSVDDGDEFDFDATTIDVTTAKFGPGEATEAHGTLHVEDVDGDGDDDVVLHFRTQEAEIGNDDTSATLEAETTDGQAVAGADIVSVIGVE